MSVLKYLPELLAANVIDEATAERIRQHYHGKKATSANRLAIVFGILGSLLVGLGIILIIAHNWDDLTIPIKAGLAFVPLIIGQIACGYVLWKNYDNTGWRESSAVFVSLAVGAAMGLISQIYNIPGDFASFMLTWMVLILPVVYVMRSAVTSLLYICGVTVYGFDSAYASGQADNYVYWLLLSAVIPFYHLMLVRRIPGSNFTVMHNWFLPLSFTILLGSLSESFSVWMYPSYVSMFGVFLLIGNFLPFQYENGFRNGFQVIGFLGTLSVLIILSFPDNWLSIDHVVALGQGFAYSQEFLVFLFMAFTATLLVLYQYRVNLLSRLPILESFFAVFVVTFIIGLYTPFAVVLVNAFVLGLGIWIVREGERRNHLGILNLGLAIIAVLALSRFFDSNITFVVRGLIFLGVGIGFFVTNYRLIKKRKADA